MTNQIYILFNKSTTSHIYTKTIPKEIMCKNLHLPAKRVAIVGILISIVLSFPLPLTPIYAQEITLETITRRDLVIDLGEGLTTDAQLTFPAVGNGPFPGVLLIHGSGVTDMDEYLPPVATGTNEPSRPFLQIAEYLTRRGFAVLRYNKRGVGLNGTILDMNAWGNITVQDLVQDAEKALSVLKQQPEVDSSKISLIGHSEGTMIAPRIAVEDPTIANIVLMGACAQNLNDVVYYQIVKRPILCAKDTFDTDHDGLLTLQEVEATLNIENINQCPLPPLALIQNNSGEWNWNPGLDTNIDGYLDIENELKPLEVAAFNLYTSSDPESPYYWIWLQSHIALKDTILDIIGNVSVSVLILQGEGDTQTTVDQAFLLEQRLTEVEHVDHTLITYPGLGHTFYPADGWIQPLGPIRDYVLSDLAAWLKDPARKYRYLTTQIEDLDTELNLKTIELESANTKISELKSQVKDIQFNSSSLQNTVIELEREKSELQSDLNLSKNIAYVAIGIAIIAFGVAAITLRKR